MHAVLPWLVAALAAVRPSEPVAPPAWYAPGDPPSPAEVLGYEPGERFTDHAGVVRYVDALAAASPRVRVVRYGETPEGRPLVQVVIAREDRLAALDAVLAANRELTDPGTPEARARAVAASNPAVVYFSYGVHGNESSSSEAALWTAWDLARGAESVAGALDSLVVVIDPVVNPDGRDRYVHWYRQMLGVRPDPNPESREHWEPWPGGRFNHYLFDLNRDWAWGTQPETRARLGTWERWSPQVHVDFHEMSPASSYFFFPPADPVNPIYPDHILEWSRYFGEANAAAFDAMGWPYYTAESFDLFYPGYGDSWPSLLGAVGMTFEQAGGGRAGLAYERRDGLVLTLRERAEHHRTAGAATIRAAAARKTALLEGFARFHRTQGEGHPDVLLVPGPDNERAGALVAHLLSQGIRVERAARAFRSEARPHPGFDARREFPAGTYRVPVRQPRGRLALTLLQPETALRGEFSYDVSAWSLPYAYGVEAHRADQVPAAGWEPVEAGGAATKAAPPAGAAGEPYGYLVAPGLESWRGVIRFLEEGGRLVALDRTVEAAGRRWPAGTFFLPRYGNDGLAERVARSGLAGRARPVESGLTPDGPDLGTEESYPVELPRIAVLAGEPVSPTSYGAHWHFLERTFALPFHAIPAERLGELRLEEYDVLVIPDVRRDARGVLGERRLAELERWVERGGTVVAVAGAARLVAGPLADVEPRETADEAEEDEAERLDRALRGREERRRDRWEQEIPGTILELGLDAAHPLAFGAGVDGAPDRLYALHLGGQVFEPSEAVETVAHFPDGLRATSGVISEENLRRLSRAGWLIRRRVGEGNVILFADDPLFRAFWYTGFQPYANALLLGPAL